MNTDLRVDPEQPTELFGVCGLLGIVVFASGAGWNIQRDFDGAIVAIGAVLYVVDEILQRWPHKFRGREVLVLRPQALARSEWPGVRPRLNVSRSSALTCV